MPAVLDRATWNWWLAFYFFLLPHHLPANGGPTSGEAEED